MLTCQSVQNYMSKYWWRLTKLLKLSLLANPLTTTLTSLALFSESQPPCQRWDLQRAVPWSCSFSVEYHTQDSSQLLSRTVSPHSSHTYKEAHAAMVVIVAKQEESGTWKGVERDRKTAVERGRDEMMWIQYSMDEILKHKLILNDRKHSIQGRLHVYKLPHSALQGRIEDGGWKFHGYLQFYKK